MCQMHFDGVGQQTLVGKLYDANVPLYLSCRIDFAGFATPKNTASSAALHKALSIPLEDTDQS